MELPLQVTLRDIAPSEAVESYIRERADKLEAFHPHLMSCRVVVEAPVRHHRKGGPFTVRIDITVPGDEIVINRKADEDLYVAIREAFDAVRRRLEDHVRRQRGSVKAHEAQPQGRVSKLFPKESYGFLTTPDGTEVYFHRNSVLAPGFDRLEVGSAVRFVQEEGERGPQASTVTIVGTHRG